MSTLAEREAVLKRRWYRNMVEEVRCRGCGSPKGSECSRSCEWRALSDSLEAERRLMEALAACRPMGQEFCLWCWDMPPHKPGCPIAETDNLFNDTAPDGPSEANLDTSPGGHE